MISVLGPTASGADVAEDNKELAVEIGEVGAEEDGEEPLPLLLLPAGPGELAVTMGEDIFGVDDRVIENEWYSMGIRVGRSVSDGQQLASASDRVSSLALTRRYAHRRAKRHEHEHALLFTPYRNTYGFSSSLMFMRIYIAPLPVAAAYKKRTHAGPRCEDDQLKHAFGHPQRSTM